MARLDIKQIRGSTQGTTLLLATDNIGNTSWTQSVASDVVYNPSTASHWQGPPIIVSSGLDELASRVNTIEQGGGIETDAQETESNNVVITASTTFVDMPNMGLTTSNTINRRYLITFSGTLVGASNKVVSIQITVNGVGQTASIRQHKVSSNNAEFTMSTQALSDELGTGIPIRVQWNTSGSIASISNRSLIIYSVEGG